MSVGRRDVSIWKPDAKGQFLVKSFYNALTGVNSRIVAWKWFWDPSVPPRVLVFCWVASLNKILTMDGSIEKKKLYYCQWMPYLFTR